MHGLSTSRGHKCVGAGDLQRILTADLLNIAAWLKQNYLKINVKKTQLLLPGQKSRTQELDCLRITLNSVEVGQHDHVKYLGVAIDSQLTWKQHVKKLGRNVSMPYHNTKKWVISNTKIKAATIPVTGPGLLLCGFV